LKAVGPFPDERRCSQNRLDAEKLVDFSVRHVLSHHRIFFIHGIVSKKRLRNLSRLKGIQIIGQNEMKRRRDEEENQKDSGSSSHFHSHRREGLL
jgi:hypothetical protein